MKKLKEVTLYEKIGKLSQERHKAINAFNTKINKIKLALDSICTHSETITREEYREGGYDYVSEYNKITDCKFCGKELKRITKTGGYS